MYRKIIALGGGNLWEWYAEPEWSRVSAHQFAVLTKFHHHCWWMNVDVYHFTWCCNGVCMPEINISPTDVDLTFYYQNFLRIFKVADVDGSGALSKEEVGKYLSRQEQSPAVALSNGLSSVQSGNRSRRDIIIERTPPAKRWTVWSNRGQSRGLWE